MKKSREYDVHYELLAEYEKAAIINAQQLLDDAKILLEKTSFARTYYLSVASIEETGKAYIAFSCKRRNLTNEGLKKKIQFIFESHSDKICSAFIAWIARASDKDEAVKAALDLIYHLKIGREKSMYVDANLDNSISIPMNVIRPVAAIDSVKVAENCLYHTQQYVAQNDPPEFSSFDDKMFCLRTQKITEMTKNEDFGKYLLSDLKKAGKDFDFSKAIVTYHDNYYCRKITFTEKSG